MHNRIIVSVRIEYLFVRLLTAFQFFSSINNEDSHGCALPPRGFLVKLSAARISCKLGLADKCYCCALTDHGLSRGFFFFRRCPMFEIVYWLDIDGEVVFGCSEI